MLSICCIPSVVSKMLPPLARGRCASGCWCALPPAIALAATGFTRTRSSTTATVDLPLIVPPQQRLATLVQCTARLSARVRMSTAHATTCNRRHRQIQYQASQGDCHPAIFHIHSIDSGQLDATLSMITKAEALAAGIRMPPVAYASQSRGHISACKTAVLHL